MKALYSAVFLIGLSLTALTYLSLSQAPHQHNLKSSKDSLKQFQEFADKYNIVLHSTEEKIFRFKIFSENLLKIQAHNANPKKTYTEGINQFSHLTDEEFTQIYLSNQVERKTKIGQTQEFVSNNDIPTSFDWRDYGAVTPVKNQGGCGACYAFSGTGAIESIRQITSGELISLSEQQVMDCSYKYHNLGCGGGLNRSVFDYASHHGITTEETYPYKGVTQLICKKPEGNYYQIKGYYIIDDGDCQGLERAIAQQPVAISIDASTIKRYTSGVITDCGTKVNLNHDILAVGYTPDYFIIKNSWGTGWGENGYFNLSKNNTCGVCEYASYPYV